MDNAELIRQVIEKGKTFQGRVQLLGYLRGQKLSPKEAIKARCYQCTDFYEDGPKDCERPSCPLHPYAPHRGKAKGWKRGIPKVKVPDARRLVRERAHGEGTIMDRVKSARRRRPSIQENPHVILPAPAKGSHGDGFGIAAGARIIRFPDRDSDNGGLRL